jgi:hypothetical protein
MINPHPPNLSARGERWFSCQICGPPLRQIHLNFTSGSAEPEEDEVLTGATSGATGVVVEAFLVSGTWAGGDAAGYVTLSSGTGVDSEDKDWGTEDEPVNGSEGGTNILTMSTAWEYTSGILYPESMIRERDGRYWCLEHYDAKYIPQDRDEIVMDLSDIESDIRSGDY